MFDLASQKLPQIYWKDCKHLNCKLIIIIKVNNERRQEKTRCTWNRLQITAEISAAHNAVNSSVVLVAKTRAMRSDRWDKVSRWRLGDVDEQPWHSKLKNQQVWIQNVILMHRQTRYFAPSKFGGLSSNYRILFRQPTTLQQNRRFHFYFENLWAARKYLRWDKIKNNKAELLRIKVRFLVSFCLKIIQMAWNH